MSEKDKVEVGDWWKVEEEPLNEEVYYIVKSLRDGRMSDGKIPIVAFEYDKFVNLTRADVPTYIDLNLDSKITNPEMKAFILIQMENAECKE